MASIDVIVPCYNYAHYLGACVHSVLSQPGVDVRVMVIDDCSPDNTPEVAARLADADARVHVRRHAVNRGHTATYNEGLADATADYVVLLSADDLLTPGALKRATDLMDANPLVGLTYGHPIAIYDDVVPPARTSARGWTVWKGHEWIGHMCRTGRNFINCPEVVMRTRVQHQIGGYRPELPHSGDMEMWLRAAAVSDIGWVHGADQAYYRIHRQSMHLTTHAGMFKDIKARWAAFESVLREHGDHIRQAQHLLEAAGRALALTAVEHALRVLEGRLEDTTPVDDYRRLALSLSPAVVSTRPWRALERLERGTPGLAYAVAKPATARLRELQRRWAWHQWKRTGVFR